MISSDQNTLCDQAKLYYFDILSGHTDEPVPTETLTHISQCAHCQAEIQHLKKTLYSEEPEDQTQTQADHAVTASLSLQFAYIGKPVACDHVKQFLPSMADSYLETRVPTPITVHLDNCRQCADDLETIQQLHLTHKQLCKLGQLFAEKPATDSLMCNEVKKTIPFMARLDFSGLPMEMLKHVCLCSDCRRLLYEQRNIKLQSQKYEQTPPFTCGNVDAADIFDYVILYGIEQRNDEYAKFNASFVSHVATCPKCFEKIQDLHNTLFGILERTPSDTVTKFQVDHSAKNDKDASSRYAAWPISVQVTHKVAVCCRLRRKLAAVNVRPFVKPAAAAVILCAMLFYFSTSAVRATDLAQIYKAMANVANVHIARFVPAKTEPIQQQWISKTLNIGIFKTPTELIVWDIPNSSRRNKNIATGAVEVTSLSGDAAAGIKKNIEGSLGLLPFGDISELPKDAQWQEVTNANTKSASPTAKVYDLIWTQKDSSGSTTAKKWRVFTDTTTNLPQRIEWYEKTDTAEEYILESSLSVDYLSESEIQAVIREAAF